jgi:porin
MSKSSIAQKLDSFLILNSSSFGDMVYLPSAEKQKLASLGMIRFGLELNTTRAGLWKNGMLHLDLINIHGEKPSADLLGDLMVFDNIEAQNRTRLYELWYEQNWGYYSLSFGLQDLNKNFIYPENACIFIHSSMAILYDVSINMPISVYPVTGLGLIAKYETKERYNFRIGVFEGNPGDEDANPNNLNWDINASEGFFFIAEAHMHTESKKGKEGLYKVGAYYHSGDFPDLLDTTKIFHGNGGGYLIIDQDLFKLKNKTLSAFLHTGFAPADYNFMDYFVGGGMVLKGLTGNPDHQLGLGVVFGQISDEIWENNNSYYKAETAFELTWKLPLSPYVFIQPDLQYIIHPGVKKGVSNAMIFILRTGIEF